MKKVLGMILAVTLVLMTGCALEGGDREGEKLLETYLENVESYETAVRELGEPASYIHMDKDIAIAVLYPETGVEALDKEIAAWVSATAEEYIEIAGDGIVSGEILETEDGKTVENRAELTVSFESYYAGKNKAGVKLTGTFISPTLAHPVDIIKTFNADLKSGEVIEVEDVLTKEGKSALVHMLIVQTGVEENDLDEHVLDHGVLTDKGIEIVLNRGDYLPMSEGTKTAFFAYDDIKNMLAEGFDYTRKVQEQEEGEDSVTTSAPLEMHTIDPDKPMVALTFDDGPSAHTERLLDAFKKHGGKGTFFVLGNLIDGREETLRRTAAEGHEIGGHSWNHRQLTNLTKEEVKDQIMMTRAKIYDATGKDSLVVRAPYGACDEMVQGVGRELGVTFYNWSIDTLDWMTKDPAAIEKEIMTNVSDGDIILCHDLHETTVDAMESVIPKLIAKGYQLVTVSELMSYSEQKVEAGALYHQQ